LAIAENVTAMGIERMTVTLSAFGRPPQIRDPFYRVSTEALHLVDFFSGV
jgi:hypothetical protein